MKHVKPKALEGLIIPDGYILQTYVVRKTPDNKLRRIPMRRWNTEGVTSKEVTIMRVT